MGLKLSSHKRRDRFHRRHTPVEFYVRPPSPVYSEIDLGVYEGLPCHLPADDSQVYSDPLQVLGFYSKQDDDDDGYEHVSPRIAEEEPAESPEAAAAEAAVVDDSGNNCDYVDYIRLKKLDGWEKIFGSYYYNIDRQCAEKWLNDESIIRGTYLLRPSSVEGQFVLSVLCQRGDGLREVIHYKLKIDRVGTCHMHTTGGTTERFDSIDDMLDYYSKNSGLQNKLTIEYIDHSKSFKTLQIKPEELTIGRKLGSGNFATVYKGTLSNGEKVAVKELSPGGPLSMNDLLREAFVMHKLRHERLVSLIGFCADLETGGVRLVTEMMPRGALKEFLLRNRFGEIGFYDLVTMAIQVADGMSYLESKNYVHRDLRAANVLVGEHKDVKIADFGLMRLLDRFYENAQFYIETKDISFPYKWTSPEALKTMQFTVKSDVWSFGILLYEIFIYGEQFYLGMSNREAIEWVMAGNRLKKPTDHYCPDTLYELMLSCWDKEPTERPSFQMIKETLQEIKSQPHHL